MEEIAEYSIQNGLLLGKAINDIYTMHINKFGKCILNPSRSNTNKLYLAHSL